MHCAYCARSAASTNAVIHLLAVARRVGVPLELEDFDRIARQTPLLADIKPAGNGYMDEFHAAGRRPRLLEEPRTSAKPRAPRRKRPDARRHETVSTTGPPHGGSRGTGIRFGPPGALVVVRGSPPDRAIIKRRGFEGATRPQGEAVASQVPGRRGRRFRRPGSGPDTPITCSSCVTRDRLAPDAGGSVRCDPEAACGTGIRDIVRISSMPG